MGPSAALSPDVPSANELEHLGIYAALGEVPTSALTMRSCALLIATSEVTAGSVK